MFMENGICSGSQPAGRRLLLPLFEIGSRLGEPSGNCPPKTLRRNPSLLSSGYSQLIAWFTPSWFQSLFLNISKFPFHLDKRPTWKPETAVWSVLFREPTVKQYYLCELINSEQLLQEDMSDQIETKSIWLVPVFSYQRKLLLHVY